MNWKLATGILVGISILGAIAMTGMLDSSSSAHEVNVINDDSSAHTVHISVTKENETVFEETSDLDGEERWSLTTVEKSGTYQVQVQVDNREPTTEKIEFPLTDGDTPSFTDIRITSDGEISLRTYWQQ